MLTKIGLEDRDGNVMQVIDCAVAEDFVDDPDSWQEGRWEQTLIWNNRVFVSVDILDCDAPSEYQRWFCERRVVAVVTGDMAALVEHLERMAAAEEAA